jgi:hypothetical protein
LVTLIVQPNGLFYGHLVHFVVIWYILIHFGILYREKSGNPEFFWGAETGVDFFFPVLLNYDKKWLGYIFGDFFHKPIWSRFRKTLSRFALRTEPSTVEISKATPRYISNHA